MHSEYVIYVIDTETTGLSAVENDVIEISACRFTLSDPDKKEQRTWLLRALNPSTIQDTALKVNKHKREDICHLTKYGKENYKEPSDVAIDIEQWIMEDGVSSVDRVFAGQNPKFDVDFLLSLWGKIDSVDTFPFDGKELKKGNRLIDTKQLALMVDLCTGKRRRHYNLGSLVKSFGSKKAKAHTATGDVEMTTDLLVKILSGIKNDVNTNLANSYVDMDE